MNCLKYSHIKCSTVNLYLYFTAKWENEKSAACMCPQKRHVEQESRCHVTFAHEISIDWKKKVKIKWKSGLAVGATAILSLFRTCQYFQWDECNKLLEGWAE